MYGIWPFHPMDSIDVVNRKEWSGHLNLRDSFKEFPHTFPWRRLITRRTAPMRLLLRPRKCKAGVWRYQPRVRDWAGKYLRPAAWEVWKDDPDALSILYFKLLEHLLYFSTAKNAEALLVTMAIDWTSSEGLGCWNSKKAGTSTIHVCFGSVSSWACVCIFSRWTIA